MADNQKSTVGPPIYVESLLTDSEYRECARKYTSTYNSPDKPLLNDPKFKDAPYRWRYKMGVQISEHEIKSFNKNMESLKEHLRLLKELEEKGKSL